MTQRYRLNTPEIAAQVSFDEAFIINFDRGVYYATELVGAAILSLFDSAPHTEAEILSRVQDLFEGDTEFEGDKELMETSVSSFIASLIEEDILVETDSAPLSSPAAALTTERRTFAPPTLEKHSELEELLMLDPMHDVDDAGWPVAASGDG